MCSKVWYEKKLSLIVRRVAKNQHLALNGRSVIQFAKDVEASLDQAFVRNAMGLTLH